MNTRVLFHIAVEMVDDERDETRCARRGPDAEGSAPNSILLLHPAPSRQRQKYPICIGSCSIALSIAISSSEKALRRR